jgi:type IV pilus assembly protein PilW
MTAIGRPSTFLSASIRARGWRQYQRGLTLIELMVSIALGLVTIAVAFGALLVSRGLSGTVSDAANLAQQGAYALRVIGQQVRQAGLTELNLATDVPNWNNAAAPADFQPDDKVAFTTAGYARRSQVVSGADGASDDAPDTLMVGYANYWEPNVANDRANTLFRSCLGAGGKVNAAGVVANPLLTSTFSVNGNRELVCDDGTGGRRQPIIGNVASFKVKYLIQSPAAGAPALFRASAAEASADWGQVHAVEVCLDLMGDEYIDLQAHTYTNCAGHAVPFGRRLHMVFRDTFQIRSQGLF